MSAIVFFCNYSVDCRRLFVSSAGVVVNSNNPVRVFFAPSVNWEIVTLPLLIPVWVAHEQPFSPPVSLEGIHEKPYSVKLILLSLFTMEVEPFSIF
jgi:hypothetical protein